jgi:hypothetical protein
LPKNFFDKAKNGRAKRSIKNMLRCYCKIKPKKSLRSFSGEFAGAEIVTAKKTLRIKSLENQLSAIKQTVDFL